MVSKGKTRPRKTEQKMEDGSKQAIRSDEHR